LKTKEQEELKGEFEKQRSLAIARLLCCGNYWVRTSDPLLVRQML
jgi:hypothetical protein